MKRAFFLISLVYFSISSIAQQQTPTLSPQDIKAAERVYAMSINPRLIIRHETLKDLPVAFPDGARGYEDTPTFEVGSSPFVGDREKDSVVLLGESACHAQLVVVGQAEAQASFLINEKRGIVTAYQFKILRALQGTAGVGATVTAMQFGGTVQEDGVTLRISVRNEEPFKIGRKYLLFLSKDSTYPSDAFFWDNLERTWVSKGKIIPTPQLSDEIISNPMHAGESIDAFAKRLARARATFIKARNGKAFCQ
jgi:hypothetical protein